MLGPSNGMRIEQFGVTTSLSTTPDRLGPQSRTDRDQPARCVRLDSRPCHEQLQVHRPQRTDRVFKQINVSEQGIISAPQQQQWLVPLDPATKTSHVPAPKDDRNNVQRPTHQRKRAVVREPPHGAWNSIPAETHATGMPYPWLDLSQQTPREWRHLRDADRFPEQPLVVGELFRHRRHARHEDRKVYEFPMRDLEYAARKALSTAEDLAFFENIGAAPGPTTRLSRCLTRRCRGACRRQDRDTVWVPCGPAIISRRSTSTRR